MFRRRILRPCSVWGRPLFPLLLHLRPRSLPTTARRRTRLSTLDASQLALPEAPLDDPLVVKGISRTVHRGARVPPKQPSLVVARRAQVVHRVEHVDVVEGLAADDGAAAGHLRALGTFGAAAYHALEGVCAHF